MVHDNENDHYKLVARKFSISNVKFLGPSYATGPAGTCTAQVA